VVQSTPETVQERLIESMGGLPPSARRALAGSLEAIARSVAGGGEAPPPMFFEAPPQRRTSPRPISASRKR
jgi:hypothetical protein